MNRIEMIKEVMEKESSELYGIYFGNNILIHYDKDIPFVAIGFMDDLCEEGLIELMNGCEHFKIYHKQLFGIDIETVVMTENEFKTVDDWTKHYYLKWAYTFPSFVH